MIPPLIHQTWKTADVPEWATQWFQSWRTHHPEFEFRLWTDVDNRQLIASQAPWFLATYDAFPYHIQRVDAVRYLILYLFGGVYVDLDFECFRPVDRFLKHDLVLSYSSNMPYVTNAIMMSKPGHPLWIKVLKAIQQSSRKKWYELQSYYVLRTTGPVMLDRVLRQSSWMNAPGTKVLAKKYFFPFTMLQKGRKQRHFPEAYGAHQHMCTWTNQHHTLGIIAAVSIGSLILFLVGVFLVHQQSRKGSA